MVEEGGYCHTVEDGKSGRLLPRGDWAAWHSALEEAKNSETRKAWSEAGRDNIAKIGFRPEKQAATLASIIDKLRE
jgi:glycosyltransferase involved in cell wall biosynthesis